MSVSASLFRGETVQEIPFLLLEEPPESPPDEGEIAEEIVEYSGLIASVTGELVRDCGVKSFETTQPANPGLPTADVPITKENAPAFACILAEAAARGYPMNIELRTDHNAQTH